MVGTPSIAILYFESESADTAHAYLSAGITDDLIIHMARLQGVNVVSREDVLPFRGRDVEVLDLGEALVVDYVLTGRVTSDGEALAVSALMTDVKAGAAVWEGHYEKSVTQIVDVMNEILRGTLRALPTPVEGAARTKIEAASDPRAYDAYLRGRDLLSRRGRKNVESAIACLTESVQIDDSFARAHFASAEAAVEMFTFYDDDEVWLSRAMSASKRALELDPDLSEARFIQGIVHYHRSRYNKAKEIFEQVVKGTSCCYNAYRWLGIVSDLTGNYDEALAYYETAASVKPYSVEPWLFMNMTHRRKGDRDSAMVSARRFLEVGIRKLEINPDDEVTLSRFAAIYTLLGEGEKARDALARILKWHPDDGTVLYNCACTYALLGEREQALLCLRTALENGYRNVREWVKTDPDFAELRDTESFQQLLRKFDTPR